MATISNDDSEEQKAHHILRISDIATEPLEMLTPISGYDDVLLVELEVAVEPLVPFLPDVQSYASIAKQRCRKPAADGLSNDESASIMLYTMGWKPLDQCLYVALNNMLRSKHRDQLEPWFLYLKLFLTALSRLPSVQQNIYREVELDLSKQYKIDTKFVWWEFSSCTTTIHVLQSEQTLNTTNTRTLFTIECISGKDIRQHSYFQLEDEILLFPITQFKVQDCSSGSDGVHSIHLQEIQPLSPLLYPVLRNSASNNTFSDKSIYVSNYNYDGMSYDGKSSFRKGDKLSILDKHSYNSWWEVKNLRTKQLGYIPANYVLRTIDLTTCEWYFTKTNRPDAVRFLEQAHHGKGTFLIRPSETIKDEDSLSVLDLNKDQQFHVKHFRIRRTDQGLYYLSKRRVCASLQDLVNHYQTNVDGLCCLLTHPCGKMESTVSLDQHGLFELDRAQLLRTQSLGRGNSTEAFKGTYGQRDVAIKYLRADNKNRFLDEAKTMKELLHKNIVRLYGVCTQDDPILIVTECMTRGCLLNYLHNRSTNYLILSTIYNFAVQIIKGMTYLEEQGYVHCDLAARNIFVGECNVVKIGDFKLAKSLQGSCSIFDQESQFRIKWSAPEVVNKQEYTAKSDVWSFGILLYELITHGSIPYPSFSDNEILQIILDGYRMPKPNYCREQYYRIMCSCWQDNPDNRPTFETLDTRFTEFMMEDEPIYQNEIYTEL